MTITIEKVDPQLLDDQRLELASVVNKIHNRKDHTTPIRITVYEAEALEGILNMLHAWSDETFPHHTDEYFPEL